MRRLEIVFVGEKKVVQGEQQTLTQSDQQYIIKQGKMESVTPLNLTESDKADDAKHLILFPFSSRYHDAL